MLRLHAVLSNARRFAASLCVAATVVACGAASATPPRAAAPEVAPSVPVEERLRADLGCTERPPGGAATCSAALGCEWGPSRAPCSGIERPDDRVLDASTTCVCTCPSTIPDCMSVP